MNLARKDRESHGWMPMAHQGITKSISKIGNRRDVQKIVRGGANPFGERPVPDIIRLHAGRSFCQQLPELRQSSRIQRVKPSRSVGYICGGFPVSTRVLRVELFLPDVLTALLRHFNEIL
jgi:hypothetical protein